MAIVKPAEHKIANPRVDGIKLLSSIKQNLVRDVANTVNARIVTQDSFLYYLKNNKLSDEDIRLVEKEAADLLSVSETGLLAIRRAYFVPSLENPPGPRYLGIKTPKETAEAIREIFDFAIEHKYHEEKGSLIEAFFYPLIDPPQLKYPIKADAIFPKGGYGMPNDEKANSVRILAVFGNNEGVQSLLGIDEYIVDIQNLIITQKTIPQKEFALCTTTRAQDDKVKLPLKLQFAQALSDYEILEAAMVVAECTKLKNKPQRVEFSSSGSALFFNEVADYQIEEVDWKDMVIEGGILVVDGPDQIQQIDRNNPNQIIYISKRVVEKRDYDTLNTIAAIKENLNILYPGTSATAHAMRVLVDAGHKAFVVGHREFRNGDLVKISVKRSHVMIDTAGKQTEEKNIISLDESNLYSIDIVGGKAYKLGKLISLGYKVPKGFVIKSSVADKHDFLKNSEFSKFVSDLGDNKYYAVRSSADVEDSGQNAFAGQFHTKTRVSKEKISEAVEKVWQSAKRKSVKHLLKDLDITAVKMAVIVQEMIEPQFSGVIFGANIETRDTKQVIIELTKGYAEGVVEGTAQVRKVVFDKATKQIIDDTEPKIKVGIKAKDLQAIFEMYSRLEENFDTYQDVEWTISSDGDLFILQTRNLII